MDAPPGSPTSPAESPLAELRRLERKRDETSDQDIRAALNLRIEQLAAQVAEAPPEPEPVAPPEPEPLPPAPTAAQQEEAENLIRQARVEKMRGNAPRAAELTKQAAAAAPGSPAVLEALGDELREARKLKEAMETYEQAMKLAPGNVALERKHAELVFRVRTAGSIDDQLRAGLSDSPLLTSQDQVAGAGAAMWLSLLVPGLGPLVLGQTIRGGVTVGLWLICVIWIGVMHEDVSGLVRYIFASRGQPNLVVLLPLFGIIVLYLASFAGVKSSAAAASRRKVDRPLPPTEGRNLPFE